MAAFILIVMGAEANNARTPQLCREAGDLFVNFDKGMDVIAPGFAIEGSDKVIYIFGNGCGFVFRHDYFRIGGRDMKALL
jgi:hypothetical protein